MKVQYLQLSFHRLLSTAIFLLFIFSGFAQNVMQVTVVDQEMAPLVGVQIYNKDFSFSGVTDIDGNWQIPAEADDSEKFTFKYVGYATLRLSKNEVSSMYQYVQIFYY